MKPAKKVNRVVKAAASKTAPGAESPVELKLFPQPAKPGKAAFMNVDLDIKSATTLDSLAAAMGRAVIVLYCGPEGSARWNFLHLESSRLHRGPDATIHTLCGVVERLSPAARRIWDAATSKEFNIGYELRATEYCSTFALRTDTLKRIVALGATLAVTYYRGEIMELQK